MRLLVIGALLPVLAGCGTDPSTVDITGGWNIFAKVHAADLREDQQSCSMHHGLIISSDTATTAYGTAHGLLAEGDTTGMMQCVLYGDTKPATPRFRGHFVVVRSGTYVGVYEINTGLLAYEGTLKNEFRMSGPVGEDVLGVGSWVGYRR
ncbi:MAG TPA: hypothetical protein VIM84_08375 [Gemmatimonadales bacterium]